MFRTRGALTVFALAALAAAPACGGEAPADEAQLSLVPRFVVGDTTVGCEAAPGVRELELTLLDPTGVTPRRGFPRRAPCGELSVSGPTAEGVVVLRALGELDGDPDATIFRARLEVTLSGGVRSVELRPEVAFLRLDWNFGDRMLEPCATEVASVSVIVSAAGGGNEAFAEELACDARPIDIGEALALAPHTIQVRAFSEEGFPIYAHTTRRVLDRGSNDYTAILAPLGGQILLDWQFDLRGAPITACDDPRVEVRELVARVQGLTVMNGQLVPDGSEPVVDRLDCEAPRPTAFGPARFVENRELELTLEAEGAHRFFDQRRITMPAGDALLDVATLEAVGTATAAVEIRTRGCEGVPVSVDIYPDGGRTPLRQIDLTGSQLVFRVENLPYGMYRVAARSTDGSSSCPPSSSSRTLGARRASWGIITL